MTETPKTAMTELARLGQEFDGGGEIRAKLLWIIEQAESAMKLAGGSDGSDEDLGMLQSIASDIAINAQMAAEKLTTTLPET